MMMTNRGLSFLIALTVTLFCAEVSAQVSLKSGAKVNTLALGSTYEAVIAKFGKPKGEKDHKCIHGKAKGLEYDGLTVNFNLMQEGDPVAVVTGFEVKSPAWDVMGIKVGDPESKVKLKFGKHDEEALSTDGKTKGLYYLMKSADPIGNTAFSVKEGKIVGIRSLYIILCETKP